MRPFCRSAANGHLRLPEHNESIYILLTVSMEKRSKNVTKRENLRYNYSNRTMMVLMNASLQTIKASTLMKGHERIDYTPAESISRIVNLCAGNVIDF